MALSKFGQAFADARKAGLKEFEFGGKKYTTKLADEVEQPSVGGKLKAGEYKTRAPYGDRGNKMTEANNVRRDLKSRMDEIAVETNGNAKEMGYVPRDNYERRGEIALSENYKPRRAETEDGYKKGGSVKAKGWGKARGGRAAKVY